MFGLARRCTSFRVRPHARAGVEIPCAGAFVCAIHVRPHARAGVEMRERGNRGVRESSPSCEGGS